MTLNFYIPNMQNVIRPSNNLLPVYTIFPHLNSPNFHTDKKYPSRQSGRDILIR